MHKILLTIFLCVAFSVEGQILNSAQQRFLKENTVSVSADTNFNRAEWKAIADQVKNKQIILLGEFNHSSKEVFQTRNSLIQYLHQKLGINVILFESGMGELAVTDLEKQTLSPAQMTNGLVGSWRTREFRELMAYAKDNNISVAGFDVQRTGGSFSFLLKETADMCRIDSVHFNNLEQRYGTARQELSNNKTVYDSVSTRTNQLISDYRKMSDHLVRARKDQTSKELEFCIITIKNRMKFLTYMLAYLKDRNLNKRWAARDSAMAENIEWLRNNIYKNQPVIVIAHNFHIAKFSDRETVMGEILAERYGKQMYALGVFAGSGSFNDNFGRPKKMSEPDSTSLDIKHVIKSLPGSVNYINIPQTPKPGDDWLRKPITINDTFIDVSGSNTMTLSKYFDGVLLIDTITPPKN